MSKSLKKYATPNILLTTHPDLSALVWRGEKTTTYQQLKGLSHQRMNDSHL